MASEVPITMTAFSGNRRSRTRLVSWEKRKTDAGMGRKAAPARRGE